MFGGSVFSSGGKPVAAEKDYERGCDGEVHVIICALDYKGTSCELTCTMDGDNMKKLLTDCGVRDVTTLYDNQCTKENVEQAIRQVGGRCEENDYFFFYYSGHGSNLPDLDGDEEDGQDEALCLVGPNGELAGKYFMRDDDFAEIVSESIGSEVRAIIMSDCCHSGSIGDLSKECWGDHQVITLSGCKDSQTSGDMGKGGIFTHSLLLALEKLTKSGDQDYSVAAVYNASLMEDDRVFDSAQDIMLQCTPGLTPAGMAWPLVPSTGFRSPLTQATNAVAQSIGASVEDHDSDDEDAAHATSANIHDAINNNPQQLEQFGVSSALLQGLMSDQGVNFSEILKHKEDYMGQIQQLGSMCGTGLKKGAGCTVM